MADDEDDKNAHGMIAELDDDGTDPDVEMQEDGSAIVKIEDEQHVEELENFYANLVGQFDEQTLDNLATDLIEAVERDKKNREPKDKMYAEATKRTGLGKEAPGGAQFEGASRAVHPMLLEAAFDFASRAIREIMPPNGPVKMFVPGENVSPERIKKADRKKNFMNWQFTYQMPEFRAELEQLLTQLPLGGAMYLRMVPDFSKRRRRAVPTFVPLDYVTIPSAASNYYTAERQCYWEPVTNEEFQARVREGMYREIPNLPSASQTPTQTEAAKAADKVEGKEQDTMNKDGLRTILEISTNRVLEEHDFEGKPCPYLISVDHLSRKVVSIVRNWEEDDDLYDRMQWMVEWIFFPWRGAQGVGLGQGVGSLAGAATGALRALLDSAHINNIPTLARLKGANFVGQTKTVNATQIIDVEGGVAGDQDIRKYLMNIPFNQPSEVLFQLLGFLTDTGRQTIHVALDKLSEDNKNLPVGTTLALIEEGMKVMSAIHLRLFHAMTYVIRILHRINRMYLTQEELENDVGEVLAYRQDFEGPLDCIPTADPEIFSDVQRIAQAQIVADRAAAMPQIYNLRATEKMLLERAKIPNPDSLLVPEPKPEEMNQVNENVAMTLGRPVTAFPEQDHLSHLQVLVDFMMSPVLGMLPIISESFMRAALQHMKEHIVLWYANEYYQMTQASLSVSEDGMTAVMKERDPETRKELDRNLAVLSPQISRRATALFGQKLPMVVQQAQQIVQQFTPPGPQMPVDPNKMAEVQRKTKADADKNQRENTRMQLEEKNNVIDLQQRVADRQSSAEVDFATLSAQERQVALQEAQESARQANELAARLEQLDRAERAEHERAAAELDSEERRNTQDNLTALRVAAAEIESKERVAVTTGKGQNANPSAGRPKG